MKNDKTYKKLQEAWGSMKSDTAAFSVPKDMTKEKVISIVNKAIQTKDTALTPVEGRVDTFSQKDDEEGLQVFIVQDDGVENRFVSGLDNQIDSDILPFDVFIRQYVGRRSWGKV